MSTAAHSINLPTRSREGSQRTSRNSTPSSSSSSTTGRKRNATSNNSRAKRRRRSTPPQDSEPQSDEEPAVEIEAPLPDDLKDYGIPRDQYIHHAVLLASIPEWPTPAPTPEDEESLDDDDDDDVAPPPYIFSAYPGTVKPAMPKPKLKPKTKPKPKVKKASLMGMPMEVREEIYRSILISHKPIPVYDGWKRVYERERPGLDTRILRVNRRINQEATGILYRENRFLYRLRDAPGPSHQMVGAQLLTARNAYIPRRRRRWVRRHEATIDIDKFGEHIRLLTIQADHNRHSAQTLEFMVEAIKTFAGSPGRRMNVHTLQIVVSPRYEDGAFTFVNFFRPDSSLIEALRAISCERVTIKIWNKFLNNGKDPVRSEIKLSLPHLRFAKHRKQQQLEDGAGGRDLWRGNRGMREFRMAGIRWCERMLTQLEFKVLQACRKHVQEPVIQADGQNAGDVNLGSDGEEVFEWEVADETDLNSEDGDEYFSEFEPN